VSQWAIGLMSGTSVDGVDGVLASFEGQGPQTRIQTHAQAARPMPSALRQALLALQQPGPNELARAAEAQRDLTDLYAEVVKELIAQSRDSCGPVPADTADTAEPSDRSIVIGAHGQTVRHRPELGYTLQLIDGARLAEQTGLPVVTDFRSADVAAGGQGAPLVPAFHALAFASAKHRRAIVNIGGIANVSLLSVSGSSVTGFDTGPGNLLMDSWCERHTGQSFDFRGQWAAGGRVDPALLTRFLEEPYFRLQAPKSTGRDLFTPQWLDQALRDTANLRMGETSSSPPRPHTHLDSTSHRQATGPDARDVQATLAELTATLIAQACNAFGARECYVCGGGAFNEHLMGRLVALMPSSTVQTSTALGVPPDAVEALAFAWLARQRLLNQPANLPAVTGAHGPRILGAIYAASS